MQSVGKVVVWALFGIAGLIVVVFCVSNIDPVTVSLYPLPWTFTEVPLFVWMFGILMVGILIGMLLGWFLGHDGRQLSAERRRHIKELEKLLAEAETQAERHAAEHHPATALPPPDSRDVA